jgi:hypothetical protein
VRRRLKFAVPLSVRAPSAHTSMSERPVTAANNTSRLLTSGRSVVS